MLIHFKLNLNVQKYCDFSMVEMLHIIIIYLVIPFSDYFLSYNTTQNLTVHDWLCPLGRNSSQKLAMQTNV